MKLRQIGIFGAGNMATALVRGLLAMKRYQPGEIAVSDVDPKKLGELARETGIFSLPDNAELARAAETLVLAVKPQVIDRVLDEISGSVRTDQLVISLAAGVLSETIERKLPKGVTVIRAMPNTGATVLAGATALSRGPEVPDARIEAARSIFEAVGRVVVVDEALMDAVTGLSGAGPAYVMLLIEALTDGGVHAGLPRDVAQTLAAQTVYGAAKLVLETGEHPAILKDRVASPGGTTIAGLKALEHHGFRHALIDAVTAATERGKELGRAAADGTKAAG